MENQPVEAVAKEVKKEELLDGFCAYRPCNGKIVTADRKAAKVVVHNGLLYHTGCLNFLTLRSARNTIQEIKPRALQMRMMRQMRLQPVD